MEATRPTMSPMNTESPSLSSSPSLAPSSMKSPSLPSPSDEGPTDSEVQDFRLPNVRRMFVPDPGKVVVDADLAGADAQVVAWEADDAKLKAAFKAGQSVRLMNGEDLLGQEFLSAPGHHKSPGTPKGRMYEALKRFVHGTNYLSTARNLHLNPSVAWPLPACEARQQRWFTLHPGIRGWHDRIRDQ